MTQLWRRANEEVLIGDDIVVKVLSVSVTFVRLGIWCPRSEPVYREVEIARTASEEESSGEESSGLLDLAPGGRLRFECLNND